MNIHLCEIVITMFSGSFFWSVEILLTWLNRRYKFEGFNYKELFLLIHVSLFLVKHYFLVSLLSGGKLAKDKKFLFANVPNWKISSQYEMQYQGSLDPWKYLWSLWFSLYQSKINKCHTVLRYFYLYC